MVIVIKLIIFILKFFHFIHPILYYQVKEHLFKHLCSYEKLYRYNDLLVQNV